MSDPRNVAHAKKVTQEKKHQGAEAGPEGTPAVQPGKKAPRKKGGTSVAAAGEPEPAPAVPSPASETPTSSAPAALESSLAVLAKLTEMEFYSRANLEQLAGLMMTVADELKQKEAAEPLDQVYSAQNALQTKLTALIETYKAECGRLQREST